jgi:hypothetical protein
MIWVRKFQYFTKSKDPEALSTSDVAELQSHLERVKKLHQKDLKEGYSGRDTSSKGNKEGGHKGSTL